MSFKQTSLYTFLTNQKKGSLIPTPSGTLFLAGYDFVRHIDTIEIHKITHILNCAAEIDAPDDMGSNTYLKCPFLDHPNEDILRKLPEALDFIEMALKSDNTLVVHCNLGISRSASIVAAFLMQSEKLSMQKALAIIKKAHPRSRPNPGFQKQLEWFGAMNYSVDSCYHPYKKWRQKLHTPFSIQNNLGKLWEQEYIRRKNVTGIACAEHEMCAELMW